MYKYFSVNVLAGVFTGLLFGAILHGQGAPVSWRNLRVKAE